MLIVLSPAKTLDYESKPTIDTQTTAELLDQSEILVGLLKKKTPKQIAALMGISDALAELNHQRYQEWELPMAADACKQAVLAFNGDVYVGLEANTMTNKQLLYAQDHLRILSGLYGVLRPLDAMLPYRLEMGTGLKNKRGKDLYAFWGTRITAAINAQLSEINSRHLLNLASNEYFRSLQKKQIDAPIVTPVFKDRSNGKYRVISFFAKKARGAMAAWVIRNKVKSLPKLIQFDLDGYRYAEELSSDFAPVFLRDPNDTGN
ncbi:peroxide stress protein YaaA [Stieleria sp. TO1_6]|uniref:peroxide stress protein YaaA n=1 Tax=Stieleria tagensis TaxID=2956795 RepID=UPI00209BB701|nr:peroxide stress protein YaaA [Stieleria tagensis]MCO8121814.1 peroxide stress protein YaaA [Stieleria tagensis]